MKDLIMAVANPVVANYQRSERWSEWQWQQKNSVRTLEQLLAVFPRLQPNFIEAIEQYRDTRRFGITPYVLSIIRYTEDGLAPHPDNPIWRQFIPHLEDKDGAADAYDGETENWEMPQEMVTPIAQHKYDNRVIIRLANVCHGYCQFCYEALRTLEKESAKFSFQQKHWEATIHYLRQHEEVEEVILSGGEPLMLMDDQLRRVFSDLNNLGREMIVRIHTRALTFNPFRITDGLLDIMREHGLTSLGVHVAHPDELTPEFRQAVARLHGAVPIIFANIPLLGGINDDVEVMHTLGMRLYSLGIIPQYLYHFMPFSPGAAEFRTSVRRGLDIVCSLKRRITNLAVPEFVLPHQSGKHTLPLLRPTDQLPLWTLNEDGQLVVRYTNWRGEEVEYLDVAEERPTAIQK
jgi:lysine 2,3-aminomutase